MLLIEDDKLVHVDSATDILEHYGVKGMKWGQRMKKTLAVYADKNTRREYLALKKSTKKDYKKLKNKARQVRDKEWEDAQIEYDVALAKKPKLAELKRKADKYADSDDSLKRYVGRNAEQEYYKNGGAQIEKRYEDRNSNAENTYWDKVEKGYNKRKSTLREFKYGR